MAIVDDVAAFDGNGIVDNKKPPEASWAWLDHWAQKDTQIMLMQKTGDVPSNTDAAKDKRITGDPYYKAAVAALAKGTTAPTFPGQPAWQEQGSCRSPRVSCSATDPGAGADALAKGLQQAIDGTLV